MVGSTAQGCLLLGQQSHGPGGALFQAAGSLSSSLGPWDEVTVASSFQSGAR